MTQPEAQSIAEVGRYFSTEDEFAIDPISGQRPLKLKYFAAGKWQDSKTAKYMPCYNPSTGAVIAFAPQCTANEVEAAIQAGVDAFPAWSDTPVGKRVQVLFRMKALVDKNLDELTCLLATENGKKWDEAMGDVLKVVEVIEFACGAPHIMKGEALMNVSSGLRHDAVQPSDRRIRRDRAVELPGHDSAGVDGADLHRHGQLHGAEGGELRAAVRHAPDGTVAGGRPASRRSQPGHHEPERGGDPAAPPGDQGRELRRIDQRRPAHLHDCRRKREARAGADRSQEPCPGAARLQPGTDGPERHQRLLRLRRGALHGPAGGLRRRGHRRQVRFPGEETTPPRSSWEPRTTRRPAWARSSIRATRTPS